MLVGVAVGFELARELEASRDRQIARTSTGGLNQMDIRFLGHACFELSDGDTKVLIDPFLTGNPKAAIAPTSSTPTTILVTHGHGDHIGDTRLDRQAHRRAGGGDRRARRRARRRRRRGARPQPRRHGRVRLGLGQARAGLAHLDDAEGDGRTRPAGLVINFQGTVVYHLGDTCAVLRSAAGRQAPADRRRADVHRRPLHDGPPRRGRRRGVRRRQDRHPVPLQHVPADRDRRRSVQVRHRVGDALDVVVLEPGQSHSA